MEFLGYSKNNEFTNPIEVLIKNATEPLLIGPDWSLNMDICDAVNNSMDGVGVAVACLTRRLKDREHQTVYLSEIVSETCMKNCPKFAAGIQSRKPFMDEMVQVAKGTKGSKAQDEALRLIKQWKIMFSKNERNLPIFSEAYRYLVDRDVVFPETNIDVTDPIPDQSAAPAEMTQEEESLKLKSDLKVVIEKARLCRDMLPESPGIANDVALAEVVGYLEACRNRLMDLIEAGAMGLLDEDVLELCLKTNDVVNRTLEAEMKGLPVSSLEDIDAVMSGNAGAPLDSAGNVPPGTSAVQAVAFNMEDEDVGLDVKKKKSKGAPVEAGKPKFKINPLPPPKEGGSAKPVAVPNPAAPAAEPENDLLGVVDTSVSATPSSKPGNDFDDFFNSVANSNQTQTGTSTTAAPAVAPAASSSGGTGAATMSDADFEDFLSNLSPSK